MAVTLYPSGHARRGHPVAVVLAVLLIPVGAGVYYFVLNVGQLTIAVTDDEIEKFSSLNITFSEIRVHTTTAITPDAWVSVKLAQTTVDLSKLRNNISAVIGLARIPAGQYTQLRIVVQSADGVLKNGQRALVQVPRGELNAEALFSMPLQGDIYIPVRLDVIDFGGHYQLQPAVGSIESGG